jgi:hypothetical protein
MMSQGLTHQALRREGPLVMMMMMMMVMMMVMIMSCMTTP